MSVKTTKVLSTAPTKAPNRPTSAPKSHSQHKTDHKSKQLTKIINANKRKVHAKKKITFNKNRITSTQSLPPVHNTVNPLISTTRTTLNHSHNNTNHLSTIVLHQSERTHTTQSNTFSKPTHDTKSINDPLITSLHHYRTSFYPFLPKKTLKLFHQSQLQFSTKISTKKVHTNPSQQSIEDLISAHNAHNSTNVITNDSISFDNIDDNHGVSISNEIQINPDVVNLPDDPVETLTPTIIEHMDHIFTLMINHHQSHMKKAMKGHFPSNHNNTAKNNINDGDDNISDNNHHKKSTRSHQHNDTGDENNTTLDQNTVPSEDLYDFAHFYSHVYPIQHKPITSETPIVVMSTLSFQQYIAQAFDLIAQYKAYLADPETNPLPSTLHSKLPTGPNHGILEQNDQVGTPRSLAVATFMNYPIVTLENLGLSIESLAYACGFSHEHIPVSYKCLGAVLKQKFQDPIGMDIRHALKKGIPSQHAGTTGKATTDDLTRWRTDVHGQMAEIERDREIKMTRFARDGDNNNNNDQFIGRVSTNGNNNNNDKQNDYHKNNEVDPVENEARLLRQVEDLEQKSQEKIIRAMISQRLHNIGVKAVVVVDDVIESRHEKFFQLLQVYLTQALQDINIDMNLNDIDNLSQTTNDNNKHDGDNFFSSRENKNTSTMIQSEEDIADAYSFSGDTPMKKNITSNDSNDIVVNETNDQLHLTKLSQKQLKISMKKLYLHFLGTMYPNNYHFDQDGSFLPDLSGDIDFNPQYTQSFFEWLLGFGMSPTQFHQHNQTVIPYLLNQVVKGGKGANKSVSVVPNEFQKDMIAYINSTVDTIKGLHLNHVDAELYGDAINASKSGGVYSLLLKSNLLSKKQTRKERQQNYEKNALQRAKDNREYMRKRLGGDDEHGWGNGSFSDDDDDDNSTTGDSDDNDVSDGSDDADEIDNQLSKSKKREDVNKNDDEIAAIKSQSFDQIILNPSKSTQIHHRQHVNLDETSKLRDVIINKQNIVFGPLIGVDFVNGIARTKRLRGSFDQRSPLIQAVLGARNAIRATPNARNPLMPISQSYAMNKFQTEFQENAIASDLAAIQQQPRIQSVQDLFNPATNNVMGGNNDKLLPFWEQLELEQSQLDQDLSSFLNTDPNNDITNLSTQSQHLLSHYDAIDRDSPLGEIVPIAELQQQQLDKQTEKRNSQLRHLQQQQQSQQKRQEEWIATVERHVKSGNAKIIDDDLDLISRSFVHHNNNNNDDKNHTNGGGDNNNNKDKNFEKLSNIRSSPHMDVSLEQKFSTSSFSNKTVLLPLDPSLPPMPKNGVMLPSERKKYIQDAVLVTYHVQSDTTTRLTKQQRIYSENSAYIVRYYTHTTKIVKTPRLTDFDSDTLDRIPDVDKSLQNETKITDTTTVSRLLRICDVTGGFGTDSFILASSVNQSKDLEAEISMVEGDKILYTLLCDGIRRAQQVHRYDDINIPSQLHGSVRKRRSGKGKKGKNNRGVAGFEVDNIYDDDYDENDQYDPNDEDANNNDDDDDDYDESNDENEWKGYTNGVDNTPEEEQEVIQSLKRDRYFPHSKVVLPKIHGLDMNDPNVQKKLSKTGKYGSSASDLHFEKMMKQQQRIVQLAEKTLKDYIEGGLGEDSGVGAVNNDGQTPGHGGGGNVPTTPTATMNGVTLSSTPISMPSHSNPLLRNKILAQQHLKEVGLIAKRMNVVYGNSLEYLARTHFRVPGHVLIPPRHINNPGTQRSVGTLLEKIQNKLNQQHGVKIDLISAMNTTKKLSKTPSLVKSDQKTPSSSDIFVESRPTQSIDNTESETHSDDGNGDNNHDDDDDDTASEENNDDKNTTKPTINKKKKNNGSRDDVINVSLNDVKQWDANPHLSPIFSPHYPYPTYTSQTSLTIHRPYDVVYMDPFYPVKNRGKRAKYKMMQRNSKFMSFAKALQDIYLHQESIVALTRQRTNAMLSRLTDFAVEREEMLLLQQQFKDIINKKQTKLDEENKDLALLNQTVPMDQQSRIKSAKTNKSDIVEYDSMENVMLNFQDISRKLSLLHSVSQEVDLSYHTRSLNSNNDPELVKQQSDLVGYRHYQEKVISMLTTNQQYEIYSTFVTTIQQLLSVVYDVSIRQDINNSIMNLNNGKDNSINGKRNQQSNNKKQNVYNARINLAKQLCKMYITLYSVSPQLIPLYTNAMLSVTQQQPTIDQNNQNGQIITTPFLPSSYSYNTTNDTNSMILTREPENTHLLFDMGRISANRRVVLKRPIYAPIIHRKQTVSIEDNKTRFDVITPLTSYSYTNRVLYSVLNRVRERYNVNYNYQSKDRSTVAAEYLTPHVSQSTNTTNNNGVDPNNDINIAKFQSLDTGAILCYDNSSAQPIYHSKLLKKNKLPIGLPPQRHLRSPFLPYLAYTTFTSAGDNNNNNDKNLNLDGNNSDNEGGAHSMVQTINRQKQLKLEKQKRKEREKQQIRKEKRKSKKK